MDGGDWKEVPGALTGWVLVSREGEGTHGWAEDSGSGIPEEERKEGGTGKWPLLCSSQLCEEVACLVGGGPLCFMVAAQGQLLLSSG